MASTAEAATASPIEEQPHFETARVGKLVLVRELPETQAREWGLDERNLFEEQSDGRGEN